MSVNTNVSLERENSDNIKEIETIKHETGDLSYDAEVDDSYSNGQDGETGADFEEEPVKLEDFVSVVPKCGGKWSVDITRIKGEHPGIEPFTGISITKPKVKSKTDFVKRGRGRPPKYTSERSDHTYQPTRPQSKKIKKERVNNYDGEPLVEITEDGEKREWKPLNQNMIYCKECGKYYEDQKRFDIHKLVKHR